MSHVTVIAVELKDLDALKAVCAALGLEFRENQTTYRWYGRHVGDFPIPEGLTKADLGRCDHAIAVKGTACKDLTKSIEAALGKTESVEKKPEFYQQQAASAKQRLGGL